MEIRTGERVEEEMRGRRTVKERGGLLKKGEDC